MDNCNLPAVREIWVPSGFNVATFAESGVERNKLRTVPEPLDTDHFDPVTAQQVQLPHQEEYEGKFRFLTLMKWEERKGWRYLLASYFRAFAVPSLRAFQAQLDGSPAQSDVEDLSQRTVLLLRSNLDERNHEELLRFMDDYVLELNQAYRASLESALPLERELESHRDFAIVSPSTPTESDEAGEHMDEPEPTGPYTREDLPQVKVLQGIVPWAELPSLYASVDAFALTSHGEGWGLPLTEGWLVGFLVWFGSVVLLNSRPPSNSHVHGAPCAGH